MFSAIWNQEDDIQFLADNKIKDIRAKIFINILNINMFKMELKLDLEFYRKSSFICVNFFQYSSPSKVNIYQMSKAVLRKGQFLRRCLCGLEVLLWLSLFLVGSLGIENTHSLQLGHIILNFSDLEICFLVWNF